MVHIRTIKSKDGEYVNASLLLEYQEFAVQQESDSLVMDVSTMTGTATNEERDQDRGIQALGTATGTRVSEEVDQDSSATCMGTETFTKTFEERDQDESVSGELAIPR